MEQPEVRPEVRPDNLDWKDISQEAWRRYTFPEGDSITIYEPVKLAVKRSQKGDSHRIVCADGTGHYVPSGWRLISWLGHHGKSTYTF